MSSQQLFEEISRLPLHERIDLMTQIAQSLREEFASTGNDAPRTFDPSAIDRLHGALRGNGSALTDQEAELLRKINEGMPAEFWQRYHDLGEKRHAETLTQEEQKELITCSDRIEMMNARRIEHLAELAGLRGVSLSALMEQLGITEPSHD